MADRAPAAPHGAPHGAPSGAPSPAAPPGVRATMSLRMRVALAVGAVLLLGGAVVLVAALAYGGQAAARAYDRLLYGAATSIAASITVRAGEVVVDMPPSAFELLALAPADRIRYRVVSPGGGTLTGDAEAPLPQDAGDTVFYDGDFGAEPARYVAVTRRFAERSFSGPVRIVVGQTLRARRDLARDIAQNALLALGGAGTVMALFAWLVVSRALRPLPRIGAALARREPTDLTPLSIAAPREVAGMLGPLNAFMARLDRQSVATQNMIGDAAHQLRTPVAAIRAQAQLALRETDPERRARITGRIERRAADLGRLLDQLLSRAMVIHRADTAPRAPLDLRDVAVEVLEACDDLLRAAGAEVALELPEGPVTVRGDALSLAEAGKNLLTNAHRHGAPPLRLGVALRDGRARLWVSDAGPGLPAALAEAPGQRFAARPEGATGPGRAAGVGGVGLAIAREVAESHGGGLEMARSGGRFEMALVLPGGGA